MTFTHFVKHLILGLVVIGFAIAGAGAQSTSEEPNDKNSSPEIEHWKSKDGFEGLLLVTSDLDWQEKWETPPDTVPGFTEAKSLRVGEQLVILTFFVNPKTNEENHASVLCGFKMTRPDHSVSIDERGASCFSGELVGPPKNLRLAPFVLVFTGEESDPIGEYVVEISLTDVFRGTTIHLTNRFVLEER